MTDFVSKQYLPSSARLAAAARRGLLLNVPFFVFGAALTVSGMMGLTLLHYTRLFTLPLTGPLVIPNSHAALSEIMMTHLWCVFKHAVLLGLPLASLPMAMTIWARRQKRAGQTNVPIPEGFSTFRSDTVIGALTTITGGLMVIALFRNGGFSYDEIQYAPAMAAHRLLNVLFWSCCASGIVTIMGGLIQLSARRTQLLRHLSLTRAEQQTELRLMGHSQTRRRFAQR